MKPSCLPSCPSSTTAPQPPPAFSSDDRAKFASLSQPPLDHTF